MQRPGFSPRQFRPFSVMDAECQNKPWASQSDHCRHVNVANGMGEPASTNGGTSTFTSISAPNWGRGRGRGGPVQNVMPGEGMSRINPVTGLFDSTVASIAMREFELSRRERMMVGGDPGKFTEHNTNKSVVGTTFVRSSGVVPTYNPGMTRDARERLDEDQRKQREMQAVERNDLRPPTGANSPETPSSSSKPDKAEQQASKQGPENRRGGQGELDENTQTGDMTALRDESELIKPLFVDGINYPMWPYVNPNGDQNSEGYDGAREVFSRKTKYIWSIYNISSRSADYTYKFQEELTNVVGYQLTSFSCTNSTPVISNHNNKLIIVDDCFDPDGPMIERVVTVPDMYIPQPAMGSVRTEREQVIIISHAIVDWVNHPVNGLNARLNIRDDGTSLLDSNGYPTGAGFDVQFYNIKIDIDDWNEWPYYVLGYTNNMITYNGTSAELTVQQQRDFNQLRNWRFIIKLWGSNHTTERFYIKDSSLLGQLGIKAFDTPLMKTVASETEFPNLFGTIKTMSIFVDDQSHPLKTLHFKSSSDAIMYEQPLSGGDPKDLLDFGRRSYHNSAIEKVNIRITIDNANSELFNLYNHTHYLTLAVMHEIV